MGTVRREVWFLAVVVVVIVLFLFVIKDQNGDRVFAAIPTEGTMITTDNYLLLYEGGDVEASTYRSFFLKANGINIDGASEVPTVLGWGHPRRFLLVTRLPSGSYSFSESVSFRSSSPVVIRKTLVTMGLNALAFGFLLVCAVLAMGAVIFIRH